MEEINSIGNYFVERIEKFGMEISTLSTHSESQYIRYSMGRDHKGCSYRSTDGKIHMDSSSH